MEELAACAAAGASVGTEAGLAALKAAKDQGLVLRAPKSVVDVAAALVTSGALADDDKLAVTEQLVEALVRLPGTANLERAHALIETMTDRFTTSQRVARMRSMFDEAMGQRDDAIDLLERVLEVNGSNMLASRRLAAARSGEGVLSTVKALNAHLTVFPGDATAWVRLGETQMSLGRFRVAAFCFAECVAIMPTSHHMHTRLGECLLSAAAGADGDGRRKGRAAGSRAKKGGKGKPRKRTETAVASGRSTEQLLEPLSLQARRHLAHAARLSSRRDAPAVLGLLAACEAVAEDDEALEAAAAAEEAAPGAAPADVLVTGGAGSKAAAGRASNGAIASWALEGAAAMLPADSHVLEVCRRMHAVATRPEAEG